MRAPGAVGRLHASCTSLSGVGTGETANVPAAISVARADSSSTNVAIGIDPWPLPTMSTRAARSQDERRRRASRQLQSSWCYEAARDALVETSFTIQLLLGEVAESRDLRAIAEQIEHDLAQPLAGLLRPLPKRQRVQLVGLLRTLLDGRG